MVCKRHPYSSLSVTQVPLRTPAGPVGERVQELPGVRRGHLPPPPPQPYSLSAEGSSVGMHSTASPPILPLEDPSVPPGVASLSPSHISTGKGKRTACGGFGRTPSIPKYSGVLWASGLCLSLPLECVWPSAALTLPGAGPTFLGL